MHQRPDMDFQTGDNEAEKIVCTTLFLESACTLALIAIGLLGVVVGAPIVIEIIRRLAE